MGRNDNKMGPVWKGTGLNFIQTLQHTPLYASGKSCHSNIDLYKLTSSKGDNYLIQYAIFIPNIWITTLTELHNSQFNRIWCSKNPLPIILNKYS